MAKASPSLPPRVPEKGPKGASPDRADAGGVCKKQVSGFVAVLHALLGKHPH